MFQITNQMVSCIRGGNGLKCHMHWHCIDDTAMISKAMIFQHVPLSCVAGWTSMNVHKKTADGGFWGYGVPPNPPMDEHDFESHGGAWRFLI